MNNNYHYPDIEIQYTNTEGYRKCIRNLFSMSKTNYPYISQDLDDVSRDELEYDEYSANNAMNFIYEKTKNIDIFKKLYSLAAARMFSTDNETGLTILLSYDYLELFHYSLICFFKNDEKIDYSNPGIIELMKRLQ